MFSDADLRQIREKGISLTEIEEQLAHFRQGFPYALLRRPALVNDGIRRLGETEQATWAAYYEKQAATRSIVKFVPASGAATRMFKDLFAFLGSFSGTPEQISQLEERKEPKAIAAFFDRLTEFAFYPALQAVMEKAGEPLEQVLSRKEYGKVLHYLLNPAGLNYGNLPKGLLKFHRYGQAARTPMEEHMVEGAHYARQADSSVHLHFTVSPEHQELFRQLTELSAPCYGQEFGVRYQTSFSIQHAATDTIAVDLNNEPFRNPDGSLLFRPAGHGALLANLGELDQDIIFIKNIDNVVPDRLKDTTHHFKKVIAGLLLQYQERIYQYLHRLDSERQNLSEGLAAEVVKFLQTDLCMSTPEGLTSWPAEKQWDYLHNKLNRPIRICGMVRNDGDTGGGPFWVEAADGSLSLQVVETAQIDLSNPEQKAIMGKATHFNPVDIVCSIRSYKGEKFDLRQFRDPSTGFITQKSKDGKDLKAQELPGLWNGAMAFWNTVFVEVPLITFNPVKTVNDLLRPEHNQEG